MAVIRAIGCGRLVEASLYVNTIVNIRNFADPEFLKAGTMSSLEKFGTNIRDTIFQLAQDKAA